jgi:hypothetical protein
MTLLDLIRRPARMHDTSIPAIAATRPTHPTLPVAGIARIAVASPTLYVPNKGGPFALQIADWQLWMINLAEPNDRRLSAAKEACLEALAAPWLHDAVMLGWNDHDLFGLNQLAPVAYDHNGLVPGLSLTALRRPLEVIEISECEAVIRTDSGARLRHYRNGRAARPMWEHPAFHIAHEHDQERET